MHLCVQSILSYPFMDSGEICSDEDFTYIYINCSFLVNLNTFKVC